jgi:hypothetical protein
MKITYRSNSSTKITPLLGPAFSFSYRYNWINKNKKAWYREMGFSSFSLLYDIENYLNNTGSVWNKYKAGHLGYPTFLFSIGRKFDVGGGKHRSHIGIGTEAGFVISHTLNGIISSTFGIEAYGSLDPFPFFGRLAAEYSHGFKLFKKIPARLQTHVKITPQLIASGSQYIRDLGTGIRKNDGEFKLNGSEIGISLYSEINKDIFKLETQNRKQKTPGKSRKKRPLNYRLSLGGQFYSPPATDYFIPQVDSFSLTGLKFSVNREVDFQAEFINASNEKFSGIFGLGFGHIRTTTKFSVVPSFTTDGSTIGTQNGSHLNFYCLPYVGLGYKHALGKNHLQHSFLTTFVIPIIKENELIQVIEPSYLLLPPPLYPNIILDGNMNYDYGRKNILIGFEYRPEIMFNLDKRIFYGLGLVFNYTYGTVGQGRVKVTNGQTTYLGGIIQNFAKIGISFKVGWNSSNSLNPNRN